jgi:hypothetical protein
MSEVKTPRLDESPPPDPVVAPPAVLTVHHDHKRVLYLPNGKVLVRKPGF